MGKRLWVRVEGCEVRIARCEGAGSEFVGLIGFKFNEDGLMDNV